jgi:fructose-bisphosphate aldolase class II
MLVNMSDMLHAAQKKGYAVPHFNTKNVEWTRYILEVCEELKSPVIIGVSEGVVKYMGGYNIVYNVVSGVIMDLKITIPVALHLDHGSSADSCKKAIDAGFTSVMIDKSSLSLDENIAITREVVQYAHPKGVTVEAEVGHVGGIEDNTSADVAYAKVEDCIELIEKTDIDFLAPALGSVHGMYKGKVRIDIDRMKIIRDAVKIPLVLHGGTGIADDVVTSAIASGVCKVNIDTDLQVAWAHAVREFLNNDTVVYDPRKIIASGEQALKNAAKKKIELFKSFNKV